MDFVTGLLISINWKGDIYDLILVIIGQLTKMVYYELVKVTIDALGLAEVILDIIVRHHGLPDSIVSNWAQFSTRNSGYCYATFLRSSDGFPLLSTLKLMARPRSKTAQ